MAITLTGDHVLDLNNFLQSRKQEHLLSWGYGESGVQHQLTHYAAATFNGQVMAQGQGPTRSHAKQQAAWHVLRHWGIIR